MTSTEILLLEYQLAKEALADAKEDERNLRLQLLAVCFGQNSPVGTFNATVGNHVVKGKYGLNYRLSEKDYFDNAHRLSEEERECVKLKPTLVMGEYNKALTTPNLDECITITPALPSIEIKEISEDA